MELARKAVHIGMGGLALGLRWLGPWAASGVALVAVAFNLLVLHRITGKALLRDAERERGFSWGIALYPAVVLTLVLIFHQRLELAAAIWAPCWRATSRRPCSPGDAATSGRHSTFPVTACACC